MSFLNVMTSSFGAVSTIKYVYGHLFHPRFHTATPYRSQGCGWLSPYTQLHLPVDCLRAVHTRVAMKAWKLTLFVPIQSSTYSARTYIQPGTYSGHIGRAYPAYS